MGGSYVDPHAAAAAAAATPSAYGSFSTQPGPMVIGQQIQQYQQIQQIQISAPPQLVAQPQRAPASADASLAVQPLANHGNLMKIAICRMPGMSTVRVV